MLVELKPGADARRMVDELENKIDAIMTFPVGTEKPIIRELIARNQVIDIAIAGATDVFTLKTIAERVRDDLAALPGITQVDIVSAPPYEISIEVSEVALRRHRMTFDQVAEAVRRSSLDMPGGSVRTDAREILLRTRGQAYRGLEYEKPHALEPSRRQPPASGRRGDHRRRFRGDRPARPLRRESVRHGVGLSKGAIRARSTLPARCTTTSTVRRRGCPRGSS